MTRSMGFSARRAALSREAGPGAARRAWAGVAGQALSLAEKAERGALEGDFANPEIHTVGGGLVRVDPQMALMSLGRDVRDLAVHGDPGEGDSARAAGEAFRALALAFSNLATAPARRTLLAPALRASALLVQELVAESRTASAASWAGRD